MACSPSAYWGSSAVGFLKNTAQIVASVAVGVVGLWVIAEFGSPLFGTDLGAAMSDFVSAIPSYAEQGFDALAGFWQQLNSADGLLTSITQTLKDSWNNGPWVKAAAATAAGAVGLYATGELLDRSQARQRSASFADREAQRRSAVADCLAKG